MENEKRAEGPEQSRRTETQDERKNEELEELQNSGQSPFNDDDTLILWWENVIGFPSTWEAANGHLPRFSR